MGKLLALKTAAPDRAAIIDEYGDTEKLRAAFAPTEKRYEQLRTEIKSWYAGNPVDMSYVEKGARWQLDVSMCSNEATINIRATYKKLGIARFLKACSVTFKALAEFLSKPEIDALTSSGRTGYRTYKSTPLTAPADNAVASPDAVKAA